MKLIETYLLYLMLTEREWNTDTEHPDAFEIKNFEDLFGKLDGLGKLKKMRHSLQPSMYNIYIKNALGDYMGRPDSMNSQTMRHMGFSQFKQDLETLIKRAKFARKIKDKIPKNFFSPSSRYGETNDPDISFGGDGDGGDGGGGE